jgi:hypothetical protein
MVEKSGAASLPTEETHPPTMASPIPGKKRGSAKPPWVSALELAEGGLLADVGVIIFLLVIYVPALAYVPFLNNVIEAGGPVPFAILMLRRGVRATLLGSFVAGFLVTILSSPHYGWRMAVYGLLGMLFGWALRRRAPSWLAIALGTVAFAAIGFFQFIALLIVLGLPLTDVTGFLQNALNSLAWLIGVVAEWLGMTQFWQSALPTFQQFAALAVQYWPVTLMIYLVITTIPFTAIMYSLMVSSARVMGHDVRPFLLFGRRSKKRALASGSA